MNRRQAARLAELSDWLAPRETKYLFELIVPAEPRGRARRSRPGHRRAPGGRRRARRVEGRGHGHAPPTTGSSPDAARAGGRDESGCVVSAPAPTRRPSRTGSRRPRRSTASSGSRSAARSSGSRSALDRRHHRRRHRGVDDRRQLPPHDRRLRRHSAARVMSASWRDLASHRLWLADETARLLEFARGSKVDRGFGWLDDDGVPDPGRAGAALDHEPDDARVRPRRPARVPRLRPRSPTTACGPIRDGVRGPRARRLARGGPGGRRLARRKEAYAHSFVLLAAASGAIAGPRAGGRAARGRRRPWSGAASGRRRRARAWRAGTARGRPPRPTAARTRTCTWSRRSSPRATRPATRCGRSARCGSPSG